MTNKILWCDETLNPLQDVIKGKSGRGYHCTKVSPGCDHCYAENMNRRFGNGLPFDNRKAEFELVQSEIEKPLRWRKPRRIFVQSMGDLFHEDVSDTTIGRIFSSALSTPWHTFIVLTKRPERMAELLGRFYAEVDAKSLRRAINFWLGVTAETQDQADKRIPILLRIPAAVRFVSVEPMLGPVDLTCGGTVATYAKHWPGRKTVNWVICGAETSLGARHMNPEWPRALHAQCQSAGVPFFMKKMSNNEPIPNDLMIREFPNV